MSLVKRSITSAAWNFGSVIIQAILQLGIMAILAHFIPPKDFGLYSAANIVIGMVALFAQIGIGPTIIQRKELTDKFLSTAFTVSFFFGIIGYALTFLVSPLVASFFNQPELTELLRIASVIIIISAYATIATALLQKALLFRKLAIINIVSYVIGYGLIGSSLAILQKGAWAIVWASIATNFISALMLLINTKKVPRIVFSKPDLKELLTFSAGVTIAQIFNNIAYYIDNTIVGHFIGTVALGIYQMAFQIMDLPRRFLGTAIDNVFFAAISNVQGEYQKMRLGYLKTLEFVNLIMLPLTIVLIFVTPELVKVVLGDQWDAIILPLQILLIQVPLRASVRMADSISTAAAKVYQLASYKILYTFMIGIAALAGVPRGVTGVAITVTIAVIANWVIMVNFTLRIVKATVRDYLGTWIPAFLTSIPIILATLLSIVITRRFIEWEIVRLGIVVLISGFVVMTLILLRPGIIGDTTICLVFEFGKKAPSSPVSFFGWKNVFCQQKGPDI